MDVLLHVQKMQLCSTPHHGERNKDRGLLMTTANHPMSNNIMVINTCHVLAMIFANSQ